jgi:hypothetical protein
MSKKPGPPKGSPKVPNSGGSRKGKPNKVTKALKDMILGALDAAGGEKYLQEQSRKNASAFLTLLGKVLPTTLNVGGPDGERLDVTVRVVKVNKP